jgi:FtsZ-binding cell division protein ZapB
MSEEVTHNMPDSRSFEERVFARFDALDARLQTFDARLQSLEFKAEQRALETKPIWERALAEIVEVKERLTSLEQISTQMMRKIDVLSKDMLTLRAEQAGIEDRLDKLESKPVQ